MSLRTLIATTLLLNITLLFGQDNPIDTLDAYFESLPEGAEKVTELARNGHRLARTNPEYAIEIGREAIALAQKLELVLKEGEAHNAIGYAFLTKGEQDSAIHHYERAIEIGISLPDSSLISQSYNNLGYVLRRRGEFEKAAEYLIGSLKINEARGDSSAVAANLVNIGIFYSIQKNFNESIKYYRRAVDVRLALGQKNRLANVYNNLGIDNEILGNLDSALYFYGKSLEIRLASNRLADIAASYNNISILYRKFNNHDTSQYLSKKALKISREIGSKRGEYQALQTLGGSLFELGRYREANTYLLQSLEMAKGAKRLSDLASIYELLYKIKEKQGLYEQAFDYLKTFKVFADSVNSTRNVAAIKDAEEKYESEKKDKQIAEFELEQKEAALTLAESNNQRNIFIAATAVVLIAVVLLYFLFSQKKKSLAEKETLLKEIHHRVKNNLQIISSLLNLQADTLEDEVAIDAVKEGQNRVKSMALIHENLYRNDNLSGISADIYVEQLTNTLFNSFGVEEEKVKTTLNIAELKLDIDTLIPLGLILNELISNALKYAFPEGSGELQVQLNQMSDALELKMRDDGPGFDEKQLESNNSYGWKMIKSLSRKLKADISIHNDSGTEIFLKIKNYKLVA